MQLKRQLDRAVIFARRNGIVATTREIVRRTAPRARRDLPVAVQVEVSNVCNLRCDYCVLHGSTLGTKVMDTERFRGLLPEISNCSRIDLSGLAEPLMNRHFVEMLQDVRAAAPSAHIAINTNATLLDEPMSASLVTSGLDELVFSLDGVDPECVDDVRRGGSLDTVLHNVRTLGETKRRAGSARPAVNAMVVLQTSNVHQLPDIVRLAAELGCAGLSVNGIEPYRTELVDHALWLDPAWHEGLERTLAEAGAVAESLGVELRLPSMAPQAPLCPQISRPIVLAGGEVVPCSVLAYKRESHVRIREGSIAAETGSTEPVCFGSVLDKGLRSVWNSAEYKAFRRSVRRGEFPEACSSCLLKHGIICPSPPLTAQQAIATLKGLGA